MYRALLFTEIIKTRGKKNAFDVDIYKLFIIFKYHWVTNYTC